MIKENKKDNSYAEDLIKKIESGYLADRGPRHQVKKTFAPSTIVYGHGECPRYWYLAFEGGTFEDNVNPFEIGRAHV